jgi:protein-tyrosine phosphatase
VRTSQPVSEYPMREAIPRILWIGNAREARDVRAVLTLGIAAVVDLAMEEPPIVFPRDIVSCRFPLIDGAGNSPAVIKAAIDSIVHLVQGDVPTLVACGGGMSRAPTITALACAAVEQITPESALKRIAKAGPRDVSPTFWTEALAAIA